MTSRRLLVAAVFVAVVTAFPALASAAKDYRAERFDVSLVVEPGGALVVTERIRFVFGDDTFTYVYRGLPRRRTDGVTVVAVAMDGQPFAPGKAPGQYSIDRSENERRVRWHFRELTASAHTFELTYRVAGVIRYEAAEDRLERHALPTSHTYRIDCASVELRAPDDAALLDAVSLEPAADSAADSAGRFARCGFEKNDSWLVRARYTARSIVTEAPAWQRRAARTARYMPLFFGLAGMILLAGIGGFVAVAANHRPQVPNDPRDRRPEPPDELPVNLGSALAQGGSATWATALATLFDSANRHIISIEEIPAGSVFRKHDFTITPHGSASSLRPSERALYDPLFTGKSGPRASLKFSELTGVITSTKRWKVFTTAVRDELKQRGVFDDERGRTRNRITAAGIGVTAFGLVVLVASIPFLDKVGGSALALGIATLVVGLVGIGVGQTLTPLTDAAVRRAGLWQAYGRHLKQMSKGPGSSGTTAESFSRLLPAAVAFGVAVAWAKALEKSGVRVGPAWLRSLPDGADGHHMAATVAMLSSSSHAADGHAGGAAGGASGAAGGGSSGAG